MRAKTKRHRDLVFRTALMSFSTAEEFTASDVAMRTVRERSQFRLTALQCGQLLRMCDDVVRTNEGVHPARFLRKERALDEEEDEPEQTQDGLRACPFCGFMGIIPEYHYSEMVVRCPPCGCTVVFELDIRKYGRREVAVSRWNRRAGE